MKSTHAMLLDLSKRDNIYADMADIYKETENDDVAFVRKMFPLLQKLVSATIYPNNGGEDAKKRER